MTSNAMLGPLKSIRSVRSLRRLQVPTLRKTLSSWAWTLPRTSTTASTPFQNTSHAANPRAVIQVKLASEKVLPAYFSTTTTESSESSSEFSHNETPERPPIVLSTDFDAAQAVSKIRKAAQWNQGAKAWDPNFCAQAVANYEAHLAWLTYHQEYQPDSIPEGALDHLLASDVVERALKAMLKMKLDTSELSQRVRAFEKTIGSFKCTPLTPKLSLRLLEANGKAGNVGRAIALLQLRKAKGYVANRHEFDFAIKSIIAAGVYYRQHRNVYLAEKYQSELENPTRWLDAILLNMSSRTNSKGKTCALTDELVRNLLFCYACTGRDGKSLHFFYRVTKEYVQQSEEKDGTSYIADAMATYRGRKVKVRMDFTDHLSPHYKLPSEVCGTNRLPLREERPTMNTMPEPPRKLGREEAKDWSPALAGAFAFAESLTHGACGHDPITLTIEHWNLLIKACCYKGALMRALHLMEETIPRHELEPDTESYNHILRALARVGDLVYTRAFFTEMTNKGVSPDKFTVEVCFGQIYMKIVSPLYQLPTSLYKTRLWWIVI